MTPVTGDVAGQGHQTGFGSNGYRSYVLGALLLAYIFNFIDRVIIAYLVGPIKADLSLLNWQFGLLSGIAFATFYTFLGIPIARLAERYNRVVIIGVSILFWSLMTALCGLANSFIMLLIFRLGVGVGEAGLTPPANSLIADYFRPEKRASALSIYASGITIGSCLAALFVGLLIAHVTWRQTFITIGLAGIPVGILILLTVKEPPRGFTDPPGTVRPSPPGILDALRTLSKNRTFWHVTLGGTLASFVGYGLITFVTDYLTKGLGLSIQQAMLWFLAPLALMGAVGTSLCGFLASRIGGVSALWLPGFALIVALVFHLASLHVSTVPMVVFGLLIVANVAQYFYLGPMYAVAGNVVDAKMRATAIAILLFVVNLIGYGIGPVFAGAMADMFMSLQLPDASGLSVTSCLKEADTLTVAEQGVCREAEVHGIRFGMSASILFFAWASVHFFLAMRTYRKDAVATG